MAIADTILELNDALQDAKTAITTAGGTVGDTGLAGLATEIATIPSGGGGVTVVEKDINFYDYDGTLVESWTLAELADKTALPANPSHTGLTAQGWNWTLADLKTQNTKMNVGQMYIPTDGKTHLFVEVDADHLTPNLAIGLNGTAIVDWGDGTATTTLTGNDIDTSQNSYHTYASSGSYEVTIEIPEGSEGKIRGNSTYVCFLWKGDAAQSVQMGDVKNLSYAAQLKHLQIGARMSLTTLHLLRGLLDITLPLSISIDSSNYTFQDCSRLKFVTLPSSVTSIGYSTFFGCYSLTSISLPSSVTSIGNNAFTNCYSLTSISLPSSVTSIGHNAFSGGYSLTSISLPSSVTSIEYDAFSDCKSLSVVDCTSVTSIPTAGTNIFGTADSQKTGLIIKVPSVLEADWKAASGWSTYADYIVGV